ncbi:hypothetical protein SCARD494_03426 [Seiridium cardinale]
MVAFELVVAHSPAGHNVTMTRAAQAAIRDVASVTITKSMATSIASAPDSTMANSDATAQHHVGVKVITTCIAILAFTLVALTYAMMVKRSAQLSNQVYIPTNALQANLKRVL